MTLSAEPALWQPPIQPVCLTIDTSASMAANGAIDALSSCMKNLKAILEGEPLLAELARIGIVTFNEKACFQASLTDLTGVEIPQLVAGGGTSYTAALQGTRRFLEGSLEGLGRGRQYYRPMVFFFTDGRPEDPEYAWGPEADSLRANQQYRANVVSFGFNQARADVLRRIGRTFVTGETEPVAATTEALGEVVHLLCRTLIYS